MIDTITIAARQLFDRVGVRQHGLPTVFTPTPNLSGPGSSALQTIANDVFGDILLLAAIAGLIAAGFIVVGHLSSNHRVQKIGIVGALSVIAGVAVAGSVAGLINFGASLKIA